MYKKLVILCFVFCYKKMLLNVLVLNVFFIFIFFKVNKFGMFCIRIEIEYLVFIVCLLGYFGEFCNMFCFFGLFGEKCGGICF